MQSSPRFSTILFIASLLSLITLLVSASNPTSSWTMLSAHNSTSSTATSSIALSAADPSFGGRVSFNVTDPAMKWIPEISLTCSQNNQTVYLDVHVQNSSIPWTQFTLWSQTWANNGGGAANCTAKLYYYTWQGKTETGVVYLAQTSFVTT